MASDVSLSDCDVDNWEDNDCDVDNWEDNEDWSSTEWTDPDGRKNVTSLSHQNKNINDECSTLKVKALQTANNFTDAHDGSTVVKRMQLNDNKAGMEGLDKARINQIIHEASKGSKFYENERQKEEQMKRRIEEQRQKICQISMEQLRQGTLEADKLLEDFEQQRDLSHTIVHIDMDAFYAAVEMRDDPSLKNKPMAVGSNSMLSTSNYHARKYGVRAAMPGFIGRKLCPDLIIVPLNFEKYTSVSKQVKSIIAEYDQNFSPMSLDEAYLDLTEHLEKRLSMSVKERTFICRDSQYADSRAHCKCDLNEIKFDYPEEDFTMDKLNDFFAKSEHFQVVVDDDSCMAQTSRKARKRWICCNCQKELPPFNIVTFGMSDEDAVNELRTRIEQKTTLTASAGIAPNMMLAKVCSDKNKPNGQYKIEPNRETVMAFIKDLPTRKVSGIGKVSEAMLNAVGVHTCTDLYEKRGLLYHLYSQISFNYFMRICLGIGSTTVERDSERKSMSTERTFSEMNRPADLYQKCEELCESLSEDLKSEQLKGKTVSIKIKTVKFEVRTRAHTVRDYTNDYKDILQSAMELLKTEIQNCSPQPLRLRLMGIKMSNLLHESLCQGKKQNTIIGAFKRLTKPAEKQDTWEESSTAKDIGNVKAHNFAIESKQYASSGEIMSDNFDVNKETMANNKTEQVHMNEDSVTSLERMNYDSTQNDLENKGIDIAKCNFVSGIDVYNETNKLNKADGNVCIVNNLSGEEQSEEFIGKTFDKTKALTEDVIAYPEAITGEPIAELSVQNSETRMINDSGYSGNFDRDLHNVTVDSDCCKILKENKNLILESSVSEEKEVSNLYSPNVRKTRSGIKRTPVSQSIHKKRKGGKRKDKAVTYECPVCSLKILCESLNIFNEHVDNCLENGSNCRQDVNDSKTVIKISNEQETDGKKLEVDKVSAKVYEDNHCDKSTSLPDAKADIDEIKVIGEKEKCIVSCQTEKEHTGITLEIGNIQQVVRSEDDITLNTEKEIKNYFNNNTEHINTSTVDENIQQVIENVKPHTLIGMNNHSAECDSSPIGNSLNECEEENKVNDVKSEDVCDVKEATSEHTNDSTMFIINETIKERTSEAKIDTETYEMMNDISKSDKIRAKDVPMLENTENTKTKSLVTNEVDSIDFHEMVEPETAIKIPISPKVIVNNSDKQSISPKVIIKDNNEQTVEPLKVYPSTSMESDERFCQMARSDAWVRKNLLHVSDEIEELNEDDTAENDTDEEEEKEGSLLVCPICNIEQRSADLNEFNCHVDMCLSRGAISEILKEQKSNDNGSLKRNRTSETPGSARSVKRRKTAMPNISKSCRSIASFFQEK